MSSPDVDRAPETVWVWWSMPVGASPGHPLWDQGYLPGGVADIPCGVWGQGDKYLTSEVDLFTADNILHEHEDWPTDTQRGSIDWKFVYGGDCPGRTEATHLAATGYDPTGTVIVATVLLLCGTVAFLIRRRRK